MKLFILYAYVAGITEKSGQVGIDNGQIGGPREFPQSRPLEGGREREREREKMQEGKQATFLVVNHLSPLFADARFPGHC
jgi:hypothetical protein